MIPKHSKVLGVPQEGRRNGPLREEVSPFRGKKNVPLKRSFHLEGQNVKENIGLEVRVISVLLYTVSLITRCNRTYSKSEEEKDLMGPAERDGPLPWNVTL